MSQTGTLTPTLTPVYSSSLSTPVSQQTPWGRLCARRTFIKSLDLYNDRYVLGRRLDCDIVISGHNAVRSMKALVSKVHLAVSRDNTQVPYLEDLSKNGTYLNGRLLGMNCRESLCDGDLICVGSKHYEVYQFKDETKNCISGFLDTKYKLTRLLGQGAFGEVFLAYDKKSIHRYAIKKIKIDNSLGKPKVQNEVNILSSLKHCCIIHMTDVIYGPGHVYIVLEYMEGGELQSRVLQHRYLPESIAKLYFYQMSLAVQYLHLQGITHRDLKPENVLLASQTSRTLVKLTDFGLSKVLGESCVMRTLCGTPLYLAPEIQQTMLDGCTAYTTQVDVWSLGCIMFYMLYGRTPFQCNNTGDAMNLLHLLYKKIRTGDYTIPVTKCNSISGTTTDDTTAANSNRNSSSSSNPAGCQYVSDEATSLIRKMLIVEPQQRITVDKLFKHPWIHADHEMRHTFSMLSTNNIIMQQQEQQ